VDGRRASASIYKPARTPPPVAKHREALKSLATAFGTFPRPSASKKPMRRFSLVVVALLAVLASGCFGGSADKSGPKPPASEAKPAREAELDIRLRQSTAGRQSDWHFRISCPPTEGGVEPTLVCQRITAPGSGFFGEPASFTEPYGGTGNLRIRGTVNGVAVNTGYLLGGSPQWGYWMGVLFGRPLDPAVRYAGGEVTNVPVQPTGVTNQRTIQLPCPDGASCVVRRTQRLVGGPWFALDGTATESFAKPS
jgi:hypothetical protein